MQILFPERLRELMHVHSVNQVQLAEQTGLKQNSISAWLLGKKEPRINALWILADYFEVDIDYLVGRENY